MMRGKAARQKKLSHHRQKCSKNKNKNKNKNKKIKQGEKMSEEQKKSNSLTKIFAKTAVAAGISGGLMAGVLALAGHDADMSLSLGTYFGAVVAGGYFVGCVTI